MNILYLSIDHIKDSAIVYFNYLIKQKININEISELWVLKSANIIFSLLKDETVSIKQKNNLKNGLISLLSRDFS